MSRQYIVSCLKGRVVEKYANSARSVPSSLLKRIGRAAEISRGGEIGQYRKRGGIYIVIINSEKALKDMREHWQA